MRVKQVGYLQFKDECNILMQQHFLEVLAPRGQIFGMNEELFQKLDEFLRIVVVYEDNHLPIGYAMTIVSDDLFDSSRLSAQTIAFFLSPEHRKGLAGVTLLRVAEADLKAHCPGAWWRVSAPLDTEKDIGSVLQRFMGMAPSERVYAKVLGGEEDQHG